MRKIAIGKSGVVKIPPTGSLYIYLGSDGTPEFKKSDGTSSKVSPSSTATGNIGTSGVITSAGIYTYTSATDSPVDISGIQSGSVVTVINHFSSHGHAYIQGFPDVDIGPNDRATFAVINGMATAIVEPKYILGEIKLFSDGIPNGWVICDGGDASAWPALYTVMFSTTGVGNVPNLGSQPYGLAYAIKA